MQRDIPCVFMSHDGELSGGVALPLESCAPEVLRRFMFDQDKSAAMMGVRPNAVAGPAARELDDLVEWSERASRVKRPTAP